MCTARIRGASPIVIVSRRSLHSNLSPPSPHQQAPPCYRGPRRDSRGRISARMTSCLPHHHAIEALAPIFFHHRHDYPAIAAGRDAVRGRRGRMDWTGYMPCALRTSRNQFIFCGRWGIAHTCRRATGLFEMRGTGSLQATSFPGVAHISEFIPLPCNFFSPLFFFSPIPSSVEGVSA